MLGVMTALAQGVAVPQEHIEEHRVRPGSDNTDTGQSRRWLAVQHGRVPDTDSFVQVRYKGYWWSIDDTDWTSKRTFALLAYLFSLQDTNMEGFQPVVTIQAGG